MTLSARLAFPLVPRLRFFTLLLVLAVVLEVAQSVVQPSRDFSYLDILANLCGVGLGALGWRFWRGSPWERRSRGQRAVSGHRNSGGPAGRPPAAIGPAVE